MMRRGGCMLKGATVLAMLLAGQAARAQTCTVATTGLAFGIYSPFAPTASSITGTVTVTCQALVSLLLAYSIQIGAGSGASFNARVMSAGSGQLSYQLYTNSSRSVVWGDGSGGTGVVSDSYLLTLGSIPSRSYTIYGAVPARQMVPPGAYADTAMLLIVY